MAKELLTLAAVQMSCGGSRDENIAKATHFVREAAGQGARLILLPELFETPYWCKDQDPAYFDWAHPAVDHPTLTHFMELAKRLNVTLPISFFERAGAAYFNTIAMIGRDGRQGALYRKSHIPDSPGYQEKFYFTPGDTGFKVWNTDVGVVGVGICWDQWFPEAARIMALKGAELLLYPTAIGSEPPPSVPYDTSAHWRRVMQGHAAANLLPVLAANRIGREVGASVEVTFYGTSFIADETGEILADAGHGVETVITAALDLEAIRRRRRSWGLFRDRRPELYKALLGYDGQES